MSSQDSRLRLLFVDDEPLLLRSMRRLLASSRPHWDLMFVDSGAEALAEFARGPVDVLVSDMQMESMDGATLLEQVRDRYPDVIRIILTGYAEPRLVRRSVQVAHQFIHKGIDPVELRNTLDRACRARRLLSDRELQRLVGASNQLPVAPKAYTDLQNALRDPTSSARSVGDIVNQDVGLSARLMQIASSALFGLPRHVNTVEAAVSYLGLATIQTLVLSLEIFSMFGKTPLPKGLNVQQLQQHALATGQLAQELVRDPAQKQNALIAGIVHDIGLLISANRAPDQLELAIARAKERGCGLHETEYEVFGVTHAEIGAYLLSIWGSSPDVVEAVQFHHQAPTTRSTEFDLCAAVYFANALIDTGEELDSSLRTEAQALQIEPLIDAWHLRAQQLQAA